MQIPYQFHLIRDSPSLILCIHTQSLDILSFSSFVPTPSFLLLHLKLPEVNFSDLCHGLRNMTALICLTVFYT